MNARWRFFRMGRRLAAGGVALALMAGAACRLDDGKPCYPGDYIACSCSEGARGYAQCSQSGEGYQACDCSGVTPGLVVVSAPADASTREASASSLLGFLEPCEDDQQCSTGLCFPFNAYGPHCSMPCEVDSDCPVPSPGCSNKKTCKLH